MKIEHTLLSILFVFGFLTHTYASFSNSANLEDPYTIEYTIAQDTLPPLQDRYGDFLNNQNANPFDL